MAIDNVRLPPDIEEGAAGGPRFMTTTQVGLSGKEQRISEWDQARCEYDISYGVRSKADVETITKLHRARLGSAYPFRFKDWMDFEATNQAIGTGDGADATWQLIKVYTDGVRSLTRTIQLPINGTVAVSVAGVLKTETTHYTVNYATGLITFTGGNIPTGGQAITASFEFEVPVRFKDDHLKTVALFHDSDDGIGAIPSIELIEVLDE